MAGDNLVGNEQAKPQPMRFSPLGMARPGQACLGIEQVHHVVWRNGIAPVVNLDHRAIVLGRKPHLDRQAGIAVAYGIVDQVRHCLGHA